MEENIINDIITAAVDRAYLNISKDSRDYEMFKKYGRIPSKAGGFIFSDLNSIKNELKESGFFQNPETKELDVNSMQTYMQGFYTRVLQGVDTKMGITRPGKWDWAVTADRFKILGSDRKYAEKQNNQVDEVVEISHKANAWQLVNLSTNSGQFLKISKKLFDMLGIEGQMSNLGSFKDKKSVFLSYYDGDAQIAENKLAEKAQSHEIYQNVNRSESQIGSLLNMKGVEKLFEKETSVRKKLFHDNHPQARSKEQQAIDKEVNVVLAKAGKLPEPKKGTTTMTNTKKTTKKATKTTATEVETVTAPKAETKTEKRTPKEKQVQYAIAAKEQAQELLKFAEEAIKNIDATLEKTDNIQGFEPANNMRRLLGVLYDAKHNLQKTGTEEFLLKDKDVKTEIREKLTAFAMSEKELNPKLTAEQITVITSQGDYLCKNTTEEGFYKAKGYCMNHVRKALGEEAAERFNKAIYAPKAFDIVMHQDHENYKAMNKGKEKAKGKGIE